MIPRHRLAEHMLDQRRFFDFWRILRQCCHVLGSPRLTAAKESTASVETSRSGSSATSGSSSRRNSSASSTAMLRDDSPAPLIFQNLGTSFLDLVRLQRRHRVWRFDSSVLPPLLTGTI